MARNLLRARRAACEGAKARSFAAASRTAMGVRELAERVHRDAVLAVLIGWACRGSSARERVENEVRFWLDVKAEVES